ncbi:hydroxyacylglutathione hydrolase [Rhodoferax lithotrophicus]|uniref:Hydroxyacylglutathione hydrolase n=2 Tax=Rhodoferax lithotrophicus TaxID=2798804 RepID=A0ABN6DBH8_9BURK|nr:hydroxyacylglutathione hydrolase [Rhodoferax sp. MIZ03]
MCPNTNGMKRLPDNAPMSRINFPKDITLFERGWLSSNSILITGSEHNTLIDSGYATHAVQTLALIKTALQGRPLDVLINTHLHSDHCGGNATLQAHYPELQTLIPPGHANLVADWDAYALSYTPTGQLCERFCFSTTLQPGTEIELGQQLWQIHAAPGHDTHSVILFEPTSRLLISADALWENGFGVVFPELDGLDAFNEVAQTLDLIESLRPTLIIPGHGGAFTDVNEALARARKRLNGFVQDPEKHIRYAAKVLIKFKLLEIQRIQFEELLAWANATDLVTHLHKFLASDTTLESWIDTVVNELVHAGAARREPAMVLNI